MDTFYINLHIKADQIMQSLILNVKEISVLTLITIHKGLSHSDDCVDPVGQNVSQNTLFFVIEDWRHTQPTLCTGLDDLYKRLLS